MFKIGDVVQLKSGGPAMTVVGMGGTESVECLFFAEGSEAFRREQLPTAALESVEFEEEGAEGGSDPDEDDED
jgi:uncharacterized protein YodC (DUF2158 family)